MPPALVADEEKAVAGVEFFNCTVLVYLEATASVHLFDDSFVTIGESDPTPVSSCMLERALFGEFH